MRIALSLMFAFLLTACAGQTFDQHLRKLEGKPVNDADLVLKHHATGQYQDGDATVYVWQDQQVESVFGPAVTGRGYQIGAASDALGGSAMIWSGIKLHSCVIRARTMDGIIQRIWYEGNPGGCETIYGGRREPLGRNVSQNLN